MQNNEKLNKFPVGEWAEADAFDFNEIGNRNLLGRQAKNALAYREKDTGKFLGYLIYFIEDNKMFIEWWAVDKDSGGSEMTMKMLRALNEIVVKKKIVSVSCVVDEDSPMEKELNRSYGRFAEKVESDGENNISGKNVYEFIKLFDRF